MGVVMEDLYSNLNKLLDDICNFLSDEKNYDQLSPYAKLQADELIKRSKVQLQEIAKLDLDNSEYDGAYVDMEKKAENNEEDERDNFYSSVGDIPRQVSTNANSNQRSNPQPEPYANLPAKEIRGPKFGSLSWKCKVILKFEKMRRIYAGLHNNWLLIYSNEKDSKPIQTFYLKNYKARQVLPKQTKYSIQDFELCCNLIEGKVYYFAASTHKDMLQWVSHINRCNQASNQAKKDSFSDDNLSETYDILVTEAINDIKSEINDEEEEDIYIEIEHNSQPQPPTPSIPPRVSNKSNTPLPPIPIQEAIDEAEEDAVSSQEAIPPELESSSSFSEEDEDEIYEPYISKPAEEQKVTVVKEEVPAKFKTPPAVPKRTNSLVGKPTLLAKPKIVFERSSPFMQK